jgi:hypothetical protein
VSLLNKFIGDNHQLKGPDTAKASACIIDLSETKLSIPNPLKTLAIPTSLQQTSQNIYNPNIFNKWEGDRVMSVLLHKNGWEFKGRLGRSFGYVRVSVQLISIEPLEVPFSFFSIENLRAWLLNYADDFWGQSNRDSVKRYNGFPPAKAMWTYPTSEEQLHDTNQNAGGIYFFATKPVRGIGTYYFMPIGPQYLLEFEFVTEPSDCDFYSPEHNLPKATEQFIKAFMQNVNITLSPDALAQKLAAEQHLLSSQESKAGS